MMFLWLPLMFLIPLAVLWTMRSGSAVGYCGVSPATSVPASSPDGNNPMGVARQRFARGEITSAQFGEIRRLLS
jgi:uncharacterized membrane protein